MKTLFFTFIFSVFFCRIVFPEGITADRRNERFSTCKLNRSDSVAIDNEYVKVMRNATGCLTADAPGFGTRVIVALDQLTIRSSKGNRKLKRGNTAVFLAGETYKIPAGDYFEIAFKNNHPPLKSPEEWHEPVKNTVVYEDEQFRIFEERLAPGDTRELHSHAQRVVIRLNDVQLTDPRFKPNGSPGGGIQVPNTVKFAEPMVHVVKNLSTDTPLFNIVIEFKLNQKH